MKHDRIINVRIPSKLHDPIEQERQRMSRAEGEEVKMSTVVRALLERALRKPSKKRVAA